MLRTSYTDHQAPQRFQSSALGNIINLSQKKKKKKNLLQSEENFVQTEFRYRGTLLEISVTRSSTSREKGNNKNESHSGEKNINQS